MSYNKKIEWYMGEFTKDSELNEICFEKPVQTENVSFSLRMHWHNYDLSAVKVYLLPSETVTIRYKLDYVNCGSNKMESSPFSLIEKEEYETFKCNTWCWLLTFDLSGYCKTSFELKFWYDIKEEDASMDRSYGGINSADDYMRLLRSDEFNDIVTIKSMEGNEHKVHKAMLACQSEVLKAHFEHNMIESKTNIVETPLENEVLMGVLTFIYSGFPPVTNFPGKLLAAADYYQLTKLKNCCEEELKRQLCAENALEVLQLADLHSADVLKEFTLQFIKIEKKLVLKSAAWKEMNYVWVVKSILEYFTFNGDIKCVKPSINT